jgi:hypothetical protein
VASEDEANEAERTRRKSYDVVVRHESQDDAADDEDVVAAWLSVFW